jgi:hypothetical protein
MELTPSPSLFSVPMRMPFARAMDLQTGGIDDDITGLLAPTPLDLDGSPPINFQIDFRIASTGWKKIPWEQSRD